MARYLDVAFGVLLGVIGTGPIVAVAAPSMVDPVQLSPQYYKVRLDNARVRVLEFRSRPGDKEAMHSPPPRDRICTRRRNLQEHVSQRAVHHSQCGAR